MNASNAAFKTFTFSNPTKNKIKINQISLLNSENENPFKIQKKIQESKEMPALYLLESIRNASKKNNQIYINLKIK